jgi:hypothetical protein
MDRRLQLWNAVNAYAQACGGDTSGATANGMRMNAVVAVDEAIQGALDDQRRQLLLRQATTAPGLKRGEALAVLLKLIEIRGNKPTGSEELETIAMYAVLHVNALDNQLARYGQVANKAFVEAAKNAVELGDE